MDQSEFALLRKGLKKTQRQTARLLGISIKAVHSYEQGWRNIPTHAERQILFLTAMKNTADNPRKMCWSIKKCSREQKAQCPAWEFQAGSLCWMMNGTVCEGVARWDWNEKMNVCRKCEVFQAMIQP